MNLEDITLSDVQHRKINVVWSHLCVDSANVKLIKTETGTVFTTQEMGEISEKVPVLNHKMNKFWGSTLEYKWCWKYSFDDEETVISCMCTSKHHIVDLKYIKYVNWMFLNLKSIFKSVHKNRTPGLPYLFEHYNNIILMPKLN